MPRAGWKRTWIKLYPIDCLEGSIRYQLEADERGVWYDLLNLSAICATPGVISDKDGRPYPHNFIANRLNITLELLERTLDKCSQEGRIYENENGIHITNWEAYQSEYERQKPYRERKKRGLLVCPNCHYTIQKSRVTARMKFCPVCLRKGKSVELEYSPPDESQEDHR